MLATDLRESRNRSYQRDINGIGRAKAAFDNAM